MFSVRSAANSLRCSSYVLPVNLILVLGYEFRIWGFGCYDRKKKSWNDTGNRGKTYYIIFHFSAFLRLRPFQRAEFDLYSSPSSTYTTTVNFVNFVWLELEWPEELFWVIERYRRIDKTGIIFFSCKMLCESNAGSYTFCSFRVDTGSERDWLFEYTQGAIGASTRWDCQKSCNAVKMSRLWNFWWSAALNTVTIRWYLAHWQVIRAVIVNLAVEESTMWQLTSSPRGAFGFRIASR